MRAGWHSAPGRASTSASTATRAAPAACSRPSSASARVSNTRSMRWSNLEAETEESRRLPGYKEPVPIRTFDAPEALDTRFYEVHAKSVVNHVPKASRMPFRWTINPYRGCAHSCVFCFARPTHTYLDFNAGRDFEREIVVKVNAPEVARAELMRPSWKREHVALGTNTDPYQWVEGRYQLMPGIWEAMRDSGTPCSVLTKSPLLLRDIELMKQIPGFAANLSVPTIDEKVWRATEPHTPSPYARIEAVAELNRAGIPTGVLVAPLIPGVNDQPEQVEKILELCTEAGAVSIGGVAPPPRGAVQQPWFVGVGGDPPHPIPPFFQRHPPRGPPPPAPRARPGAPGYN